VRQHRAVDLAKELRVDGWKALGIAVLVGAIPGAALYLLPPILVAVTGVLFVPFSFASLRDRVAAERVKLGLLEAPAPAAA
jgi:hypothetical protein